MPKVDTTQEEINAIIRNARHVTTPAYTLSASAYQYQAGVHEPWIMEISGTQYSRMSARGKTQYDHKRGVEWGASSAIKQEWRRLVMRAFDEGVTDLEDPDLHHEAKSAIHAVLREREAASREAQKTTALRNNRITDVSQLTVGDQVFDIMTRKYCTVTKLFKASAYVARPDGLPFYGDKTEIKARIGQLQWLSYDDAVKG